MTDTENRFAAADDIHALYPLGWEPQDNEEVRAEALALWDAYVPEWRERPGSEVALNPTEAEFYAADREADYAALRDAEDYYAGRVL